jgi:hypothetical protein
MVICLTVSGVLMAQTFTAANSGGSLHDLGGRLLLVLAALGLVALVTALGLRQGVGADG